MQCFCNLQLEDFGRLAHETVLSHVVELSDPSSVWATSIACSFSIAQQCPIGAADVDDSLLQHTRYRVSQATKSCIRNTDKHASLAYGYLESATSAGCKAMPASCAACGPAMLLSLLWNAAVFQSLTQLALEEATDLTGSAAAPVSGSRDVIPAALPPAIATAGCWNSDSCAFRVRISCSRSCRHVQSISRRQLAPLLARH